MKKIVLIFCFLLPLPVFAQQQLTLDMAIDSALKNNLDIQIARNYVEIARVSNNYGMAGGLPNIYAGAGDNLKLNNINQNFSDGTETNLTGIIGNSVNAEISADLVLFNGFKVIATKKRLNLLQKQSEIELNAQVQDIIASVMIKYYDIIRQQNYLRIIKSMFDVSQKKLEIVNEKNRVGMANGVDIMQAQSDVNTAQQNLIVQKLEIDQATADLLLLMNSKSKLQYIIDDSIVLDNIMVWDSINNYLKHNPQILSAEQQVKISEQIVKETSAQRYPSLKLNTAYDFGRTDNNSGYTLLNQNYGPSAGLILQIPIFNGNRYRTQKIVAGLNLNNAKLEKENLSMSIETIAIKKHLAYKTVLDQIESQQKNFYLAQKLVELVLQNFQHGQATIVEVKTAQASYENAAYQLINYQYLAKVSEIELKQLIYKLSY